MFLGANMISSPSFLFTERDVMNFLGRKLNGHFPDEIISDMKGGE
jgi:hypothetical protein